jgi:hypothetical protein
MCRSCAGHRWVRTRLFFIRGRASLPPKPMANDVGRREVLVSRIALSPEQVVARVVRHRPPGTRRPRAGEDLELPILVLSFHDEETYAVRAIRAGANGYLIRREQPETVLRTLRKVLAGEVGLSSHMNAGSCRASSAEARPCGGTQSTPSDGELEVLMMLGNASGAARSRSGRISVLRR